MKPKKIIVIVDPHEGRRGTNRLALWVNGFHAIGVPSLAAARELVAEAASAECGIDLLIGYWPVDEARFAQLGKEPRVPTIYMASKNGTTRNLADITLDAASMADLIGRINLVTLYARRRGPTRVSPQEALRARA